MAPRLDDVLDVRPAIATHGRRLAGGPFGEALVQPCRRDSPAGVLIDSRGQVEHAGDPLAGQGRHVDHRRVTEEGPFAGQGLGEFVRRPVILFDQVPFVHDDHAGQPAVEAIAGDVGVLGRQANLAIDDNDADVGATDSDH